MHVNLLFSYSLLIVKSGVHRNFEIAYMKGEKVSNVHNGQFKDVSCFRKHIRKKQKCPEAPFELQKPGAVYQNLENIFKLFVDSCDLN